MNEFITSVDLAKSYRLLNHGPTVLVSSAHNGVQNVMAAAWNMALDFSPAKVAVVIDKSTLTRELVEASGTFALNIPSRAIAKLVLEVGHKSGREFANKKLDALNVPHFAATSIEVFLIEGCVGWLECKVIPEPHIQKTYDLFLGEVIAAHADSRVFENGHWKYDANTPEGLQTLHYVAGNTFISATKVFSVDPRAKQIAQISKS
jgi:flavin reductase (DIM6/NTAB) family NADH-FMN oxidoreductase RutF